MHYGYKVSAFATLLAVMPMMPISAQRSMRPTPIGQPGDWITADDYPPEALRDNRTGRVVVALGIDSTGRVVSCSIEVSSGTTTLDQKTCEIATARGNFEPATDAKGVKIASIYRLPVYWKIPDTGDIVDLSAGPKIVSYDVETVIGEDGNLISCKTIARSDTVTSDPCAKAVIGSPTHTNYKVDGQPVRTVIRQRFSSSVTAAPSP